MKKGYFIDKEGYVAGYGEAASGTANFIQSAEMSCRTAEGFCLKANASRSKIEYVRIREMAAPVMSVRQTIASLKAQLDSSDWAVIKCYDRGLVFAQEYPEYYTQREALREQINELESQLF